ncbi:hypothetical protein ACOMHN_026169 [Nucella lapillus]
MTGTRITNRNGRTSRHGEEDQERGGGAGTRRRSRNEEEEQERGGGAGTRRRSRNVEELKTAREGCYTSRVKGAAPSEGPASILGMGCSTWDIDVPHGGRTNC